MTPYHICFKEQIQLFVYSWSYILSYFSKPAVFACLGGDFLTQFLYFKGGGAAVVTLLLVVEWWLVFLVFKRFSVKRYALLWSLLPVIVEWILFSQFSFSLAMAVSFVIVLATFILYAKNDGKRSVVTGVILIPLLYMVAGASVFLFIILAVLYDIHCRRKRYVFWAVMLALSLVIPFLVRHGYLLTLKQAYFYPYPDVKHALSLVTLASVVLLFVCFKRLRGQNSGILYFAVSIALLGSVLIAGLVKTTDMKNEHLFGIMVESYHKNWDQVLEIAEKADLQNPVATCYTNIALSQKSLLGERFMDFYQPFSSGLVPVAYNKQWLALFTVNDAYFHIGAMDMAQHGALLGMVASPKQRSARMLERLVEINMAIDDMPATDKYKRMLESTLFHKVKPDMLKNIPRQGIFREDLIHKSSDVKTLLELLVESDPDNIPAVNYLLCFHLLNKNIPAFFKTYTSYFKGKYESVPKNYAEALLIYFAATNSTMKEVAEYGIHSEIIKSFREYTQLYEDTEGILNPVQEKFPNTYWLFYHFAVVKNEE